MKNNLNSCVWWCVRRELQDSPKQILGGLPTHPDEYAALGPAIAPRPRTIKLVRQAEAFLSAEDLRCS